MKASLCFVLELPWQQTIYEPLKRLALSYIWSNRAGEWVFRIEDIKKVEALLSKTIEIEGYSRTYKKQIIPIHEWKGKDKLSIIEYPKIYQIVEHRKREDGSVEERRHDLDKEIVNRIWDEVISHQPLNKPIKTRTVAEKICNMLGIVRFNRETGSFNYEMMFGNRPDYFRYFHYPMKVLAWQGKIIHHKSGKVERIV